MKNKKSEKFGKPSSDIFSHKKDFILNNDQFFLKGKKINKLYSTQPKRKKCMNCNFNLGNFLFKKLYVSYTLCKKCGHLNGLHKDTNKFCKSVYTDNSGKNYSKNYDVKNIKEFKKRSKDIYLPKAKFLLESLSKYRKNAKNLLITDFGAGSGYFLYALRQLGCKNISGYEISKNQVYQGNKVDNNLNLNQFELNNEIKLINSLNSEVFTMIGVLEHLQNPRTILKAISKNKNIKYLYISVPLFSISVFFEIVFPKVMQRQLIGAHTHLYTKSSLEFMSKHYNFKELSSWWFGTDMMDLYRCIYVMLEKNSNAKKAKDNWSKMFIPMIDKLQLNLDQNYLSDEVHILYKIKH